MSAETDAIRELLTYYDSARQVGHTHAMLAGGSNSDCMILCVTRSGSDNIDPKKLVSLGQVNNGRLRGMRKPILIDNHAMYALLSGALCEINALEKQAVSLFAASSKRATDDLKRELQKQMKGAKGKQGGQGGR